MSAGSLISALLQWSERWLTNYNTVVVEWALAHNYNTVVVKWALAEQKGSHKFEYQRIILLKLYIYTCVVNLT